MVTRRARSAVRRSVLFVVALGLVAVGWEVYKALGPDAGGDIFGWKLIPKTNDRVMPHTWEMFAELTRPAIGRGDQQVWQVLLGYSWYTFQMSVAGLIAGTAIGVLLAVLMARFGIVERGLLPYVVLSQTIPLIALAPQVTAIRGSLDWPQCSLPVVLSDHGVDLARFASCTSSLTGVDGELCLRVVDDSTKAAVPDSDSVHGPWPEACCNRIGDRRDRHRDHPRWAARRWVCNDRLQPEGHVTAGVGVRRSVCCSGTRPRDVRHDRRL